MAGWQGAPHVPTHERGTGTTGQIEQAHEQLDQLGVPAGPLATRVQVLAARHRSVLNLQVLPPVARVEVHGCDDVSSETEREGAFGGVVRHGPTVAVSDDVLRAIERARVDMLRHVRVERS